MMVLAPLIVAQGALAVAPWDGSVQVMNCGVTLVDGSEAKFALTLMDDKAFIAEAGRANIEMDKFEPTTNGPNTVRGNATIRRAQFDAGDTTLLIRQLYENRELRHTFIVIGGEAKDEQGLAFEKGAGFCLTNSIETKQ